MACEFCRMPLLDTEPRYITPSGGEIHELCLMGYAHEHYEEFGLKKMGGTTDGDYVRTYGAVAGGVGAR